MTYRVIVHSSAVADLKDVPAQYRRRLIELIDSLAADPMPSRSKQLEDPLSHLRRIPLEQWRVIYDVVEDEQEINVYYVRLKTGPETYADLE